MTIGWSRYGTIGAAGTWSTAQVASAPKGTDTGADIDALDVPATHSSSAARPGRNAERTVGTWEVQGNVIRGLAALNRAETLPWGEWGLIPVHYDELDPADVKLLDDIAAVSAAGGPALHVAAAYHSDPRVPVPEIL